MGWYYLSRSSLLTLFILLIWLIANIFVNVPPDFNTYQGEVIHKELVNSDTARHHNGSIAYVKDWYNFTYLTKSGHAVNVENYEYEDDDYNFDRFEKENKFYVTSGWTVTIFVLLCVYGFFGSFITLACDAIDDIDEMIDGRQTKIKAREMRFRHYKALCDLFGYKNDEDRQLTYQAIEMAKNNSNYKRSLECGGSIRVPSLTCIDEMVDDYTKELIKEKQKEVNND